MKDCLFKPAILYHSARCVQDITGAPRCKMVILLKVEPVEIVYIKSVQSLRN
jgi:hypothetical protein